MKLNLAPVINGFSVVDFVKNSWWAQNTVYATSCTHCIVIIFWECLYSYLWCFCLSFLCSNVWETFGCAQYFVLCYVLCIRLVCWLEFLIELDHIFSTSLMMLLNNFSIKSAFNWHLFGIFLGFGYWNECMGESLSGYLDVFRKTKKIDCQIKIVYRFIDNRLTNETHVIAVSIYLGTKKRL